MADISTVTVSGTQYDIKDATARTTLSGMSGITTITKSLKVTTDWMDTGISSNNLSTGAYIVQLISGSYANNGNLYSETYIGLMQWFADGTNSSNSCEILLHNSGHADNSQDLFLRTLRHGSGVLTLQIAAKIAFTNADTLTFKFRKIM